MAHLCIKCQAISMRGLDDLGLQLLPGSPGDDGIRNEERQDWADGLFYLHHSNLEELRIARDDGCHLCSLIDFHLRETADKNWVDMDENQVLLVLRLDIPTIVPLEKHYMQAYVGSKCTDMLIYFSSAEDIPIPLKFYSTDSTNVTTGSPQAVWLASKWLDHCLSKHECGSQENVVPELPTRVIDVGGSESPPALFVPKPGQRGSYMALSYCWGSLPPDRFLKTTLGNMDQHQMELPPLPPTLEQAIDVTRRLGCRYLWVDALCIVQDWDEDRNREIANMGEVYRNAIMTIAAANGVDVYAGLYVDRHPLSYGPLALTIQVTMDGESRDLKAIVFQEQSSELLLRRRLWVLQEEILSPRTLLFGPDGLRWECSEIGLEQGDPIGERPEESGGTKMKAWISKCSRIGHGEFPSEDWYTLICHYSMRIGTDVADQLPAIAGVVKVMSGFHNWQYLAGLWREDLVYGLGWYKDVLADRHPRSTEDTNAEGFSYIAPSWSWASRPNGSIGYEKRHHFNLQRELVTYIEARCGPKSTNDGPFGRVAPGSFLRLKGRLKAARARPITNEYVYNSARYSEVWDYRICGSWASEVVDPTSGKIVGFIFLDNQPDKTKTFEIWCLPILELNRTARCPYYALCLGLVKNGESGEGFRRVGLVGLMERLAHYHPQYFYADAKLRDESDLSESERVEYSEAAAEVQIWHRSAWDNVPQSHVTIV